MAVPKIHAMVYLTVLHKHGGQMYFRSIMTPSLLHRNDALVFQDGGKIQRYEVSHSELNATTGQVEIHLRHVDLWQFSEEGWSK